MVSHFEVRQSPHCHFLRCVGHGKHEPVIMPVTCLAMVSGCTRTWFGRKLCGSSCPFPGGEVEFPLACDGSCIVTPGNKAYHQQHEFVPVTCGLLPHVYLTVDVAICLPHGSSRVAQRSVRALLASARSGVECWWMICSSSIPPTRSSRLSCVSSAPAGCRR